MPGELAKMQKRVQGAKAEVGLGGQGSTVILPIFRAPVFIGHGVTNPKFVPGLRRGDFVGEDSYGWGVHHGGLIDCVNLDACDKGFSLLCEQSWGELWLIEHNEDKHGNPEPVRDFLSRIVVLIRLDPSSVKRIPNPEVWDVEVQKQSGEVVNGSPGKLVLKSRPSEANEAIRSTFFRARRPFPDFTEGSKPWVTNK